VNDPDHAPGVQPASRLREMPRHGLEHFVLQFPIVRHCRHVGAFDCGPASPAAAEVAGSPLDDHEKETVAARAIAYGPDVVGESFTNEVVDLTSRNPVMPRQQSASKDERGGVHSFRLA
jgi:hypothetical protein